MDFGKSPFERTESSISDDSVTEFDLDSKDKTRIRRGTGGVAAVEPLRLQEVSFSTDCGREVAHSWENSLYRSAIVPELSRSTELVARFNMSSPTVLISELEFDAAHMAGMKRS